MPPTRYRKLGVLAILSLFGGETMAQALPALRVDPALLGVPPAPAKESAARKGSADTPPAQAGAAPNEVPARPGTAPVPAASASAATSATPSAPAVVAPAVVNTGATAAQPAVPPARPFAHDALPPLPPRPRARGVLVQESVAAGEPLSVSDTLVGQQVSRLPPLRVDPLLLGPGKIAGPATTPAVVASAPRPCYPAAATPAPGSAAGEYGAGSKLPPLRVDPALLGSAATTGRPSPDAATLCDDAPTRLAAVPPPRRAGVPLSRLPATVPRIPLSDPDQTSILADSIRGNNETEVVAEGNVELAKNDAMLQADKVIFRQPLDEVEAIGNVRLSRDTEELVGSRMKLHVKDRVGFFDQPQYVIQRSIVGGQKKPRTPAPLSSFDLPEPPARTQTTGRGEAARLHFEGEGNYRLEDATFSTCQPNRSGNLDWYAQVADLKLDYNEGRGTGRNTTIFFKDVPILYAPYLDFPLNNERKSGLLTPSIGTSTNNGIEFTQPIYWNIAPNMDATFAPRLMSKRGLQLRNEFRYLQPDYTGQVRFEFLAKDRQLGDGRHAYNVTHQQAFGAGFSGTVQLNGVSDDNYFKDLENSIAASSNNLVLSQGTLNYGGGWWSAALTAQRYQVLQDIDNPVDAPYARLPQLTVSAERADLPAGLQFNFGGEFVRFASAAEAFRTGGRVRMLDRQDGTRRTLYPQLSLPLLAPYFYLTPKIGYHATDYTLDAWTDERTGVRTPGNSVSRRAPIYSIDSGLTFERPTLLAGKAMTQTLEPRLYYVRIPYRDQDLLPLFDTGIADFNFAQIFSENRFAGGDRLGDTNQLTAMATSRWIEPDTGAERVRLAVGQRFYFSDQRVDLDPATNKVDSQRKSDLLASVSGQFLASLHAESAAQYSQSESKFLRYNVGMRYQPEIGKVISANYRYIDPRFVVAGPLNAVNRNAGIRQVDVSGQWPLGGGWFGVGRYNYSLAESRLIESIGGLEYDAGCWIVRGVARRAGTAENDNKSSLFVQLELKDFSRIGANPLNLLKRSVPGYREINTLDTDPNFASQ